MSADRQVECFFGKWFGRLAIFGDGIAYAVEIDSAEAEFWTKACPQHTAIAGLLRRLHIVADRRFQSNLNWPVPLPAWT